MDMGGAQKFIPADAEPVVLELLERLGRLRALNEDESELTEALVRRERRRAPRKSFRWGKDDNRELLRIQHRPGGIQKFADKRGITYKAAFQQLSRLRNLLRGGAKSGQVEG